MLSVYGGSVMGSPCKIDVGVSFLKYTVINHQYKDCRGQAQSDLTCHNLSTIYSVG